MEFATLDLQDTRLLDVVPMRPSILFQAAARCLGRSHEKTGLGIINDCQERGVSGCGSGTEFRAATSQT